MNFPVPWRALLPSDALEVLTGPNGSILKEICNASGASVEISGEGETPETLSDKIVTISGAVEQKEAATRRAVDKLRVLQEVADQEPGVFVIIVPSCAAPMVVGQRGTQIKEVIELSGAEISVGKENILGMVDQPIGITGTGGQVVSAVSKINAILQDLADRGKLQPSDFKYRPGAVPKEMSMGGPRDQGPRMTSTSNPRTHAKFVVATQVAGWIIGKQGRHIRELQENSGAHIQILKEGDVPPGVSPTDRIVEIGGRFDARAEGIQIVLMAIDSMPALAAPRETLMLVTRSLTQDAEIRDVQQMSGAEVEVRDLPGYDEALCTLLGTIEGRVKAAQQFLTRLEELAGSGAGPATPAPGVAPEREAYRQPAPAPAPAPRREEPPARIEPASTGNSDPWSQKDPWGGSAMPAKSVSQSPPVESAAAVRESDPWSQPAPRAELPAPKTTTFREPEVITYNPDKPASTSSSPPQQLSSNTQQPSFGSGGQQSGAGSSFGAGGQQSGAGTSFGAGGGQQSGAGTSFGAGGGQQSGAGTSFGAGGGQQSGAGTSFSAGGQQSGAGTSFGAAGQQNGASTSLGGGNQQTSFGGGGQQNGAGTSFGGSSQQSGAGTSFGSSGQQNSAAATSFGSNGQQGSTALANFDGSNGGNNSQTSFGGSGPGMGGPMGMGGQMGMGGMGGGMGMMNGMGGPMGMMGMGGGMGGMGMGAMGPMAFQAMLQQSMMGQHEAQLALLLPVDLIQQVLIPHGHLAEIAQTCNISIDLGAEISSMRQVSLRGTIAANAMAAYFLQERSLQYTGGKNP